MHKKNKIFLLILLVLILLIILLKNIFFHVINLKEYPNEKLFYQQIITPGKQFCLKYIHSVARTPVWEFFEMNKEGQVILIETHFYDHGAGLPYAAFKEEIFVSEDGIFKIKNMSREIKLPLYYRIGQTSGNHFIYNHQDIDLSEKLGDAVVTIDIMQINLFDYFINNINIYRLGETKS